MCTIKKFSVSAWRCRCCRLCGRAVASCSMTLQLRRWRRTLQTSSEFSELGSPTLWPNAEQFQGIMRRPAAEHLWCMSGRCRWRWGGPGGTAWTVYVPQLAANAAQSPRLKHGHTDAGHTRVSRQHWGRVVVVRWSCTTARRAERCRSRVAIRWTN